MTALPLTEAAAQRAAAWAAGDDGLTCCQAADLRNERSSLDRRYDVILLRGDLTPSGLWPSDHAGVVATVLLMPRSALPR